MESQKEKNEKIAKEYIQKKLDNARDERGKIIFTMSMLVGIFQAGVEYSFKQMDEYMTRELMIMGIDKKFKELEKN